MRLSAIAVAVKVILVIDIFIVLIVFLIIEQLTRPWHSPIATVTSEVKLRIKFYHIMTLMTLVHATNAYSMRLDVIHKICITW